MGEVCGAQFGGQHDRRDVGSEPAVDAWAVAGGGRFRRRRGRKHFRRARRPQTSAPKKAAAAAKKPGELKAGQFEWHPDRSPSGPLAIIVSLTKQRVYVYRNGIQIGVSTCSTGKKDYDTPTGVFTILEKEEGALFEHL